MFTKFIRSVLVGCLLSICQFSAPLLAGVPQLISYQGRVVVDGVNFDSGIAGHPGIFRFALVSGDGSATYWSNDGSSVAGSEPIAGVSLPVSKGLYSVPLGEVQAPLGMTPIALSVFANPDVRLRVWFDDGIHGSQLLSPDQRVAAVGYAMMAAGVADGAVQAASIAPGAVDNTKLSNASITISAGAGLAGGGVVPLGGTITLGNAGVLSLAGGGGITVSNATGTITLGSNATDVATPNSLVMRDASGNFKAGNITADLFGNASSATTALTAGTALTAATAVNATNFSGPLLGDVTGNQGSTLVAQVGGKSAAMIATGTDAANGATDLNMAGALVKRNANGDFSARQITAANFAGDGAALTGVPGTFIWQTASGTAQAAVANTGYLADNPAQVTLTLPANATVGDIVRVNGVGAGGWKVIPAVTQGIVGFDAGQGPAGSQGTGTAVQFIGNGQWQPTGESVLPAGVVQSQQIANGAVTSAKMAGGSIGSAQLTTGAVQSANIAAGAVDNTKLANPSLTLNTGTGLAGGGDIALGGTRTLSIADSGVGSAQLAPGAALANLSLGGLSLGTAGVPTFAGAKLLNIGTGDNKPELLFDRGITPKGRVTYQRTAQDAGWSGLVFSINADWNDATGYVYDDGGKSQSILQMEYEYTDVHGNQLNELNWTVSGYRTLHFTTDVHDTSRSICNLSGCTTIDFPVANPTVLNDEAGRIFRATAARDNGDVQAWIGNYSDSSRGAGLHLASRSTTDQWSDNPADWVSLWSIHSDPRGNGSNEFGIIDHHLGAYRFLINQAGNIGIKGNINPQYALDVNGDVNVSGTFRVNGIVATIPKQGVSRLAVEMATYNGTTQTVAIAPNSYSPAVVVTEGTNVAKMMSLDPAAWIGRSVKLRMLVAVNGTNGQDVAYRLMVSYTTKTLDGSSNAGGFVFPDPGYAENTLPDGTRRTTAAPTVTGAAMWIESAAITIPNDATALAATFELAKAIAGDTNTDNGYIIECRVTEQ